MYHEQFIMNVTYLFGAGASALTLPVVKDFPVRLEEYSKELLAFRFKVNRFPDGSYCQSSAEDARDKILKDLEWLVKECKNHSSIDTFAKKLFLTKNILGFI